LHPGIGSFIVLRDKYLSFPAHREGGEATVPSKPRDRILRTAVRLFSREGIQAVGVNRIIVEADVAPTTLYRQFSSKDQLVAAALEQWGTDWLGRLRDQVERGGDDFQARLDGLWSALSSWFAMEDFPGSFIANAAAELRGMPDHPARAVIVEQRAALRQLLGDLAQLAGVRDATALSEQLLVLVDGAIAIATVDRRPDGAARASATARALLSAGIAAATPAPGSAFCRGRPGGAASSRVLSEDRGAAAETVAARTAALTAPRRRP